jgi:glutamate racemase
VVGILATEAMVRSHRMADLVARFAREREVIIQPCPGLVEQVERQALHTPETARLLLHYLEPILARGADTLVLGCTHYPFLSPAIEGLVGPGVTVIDTAPAIARRLQALLEQGGLLNNEGGTGQVRFFSSGDAAAQTELFSRLWGETVVVESLQAADVAIPAQWDNIQQ